MFKIALKSLLGHKLRMFLTAFSIIIGVSFVAGSYIFTDSIKSTFDGVFDDVYTSVDVIVRPSDTNFDSLLEGIDESILADLEDIDEIRTIEGGVGGSAFVIFEDGSFSGQQGPPSFGLSWGTEASLNPLRIADGDGRGPERDGEVAIDLTTAKQNNISVGDTVSIQAGESPLQDFEVVGLTSFGETDSLAGATTVSFEFEQARELFDLEGRLSDIRITAENDVTPEELRGIVATQLPEEAEAVLSEQQQSEELEEINSGLNVINTALLAFAGVSVFVGSFIIQNTFRIIIAQRSKELALLRAIGAVRGQIIRLVAYEALIIAVIASLVGIVVGMGLAQLVRAAINASGATLPDGPLTLEPRTVYISLAVGVIVTVVAALMPAIKASRVSPVEAMRDSEVTTPARSLRLRALSGILVTGLGAASLLYGLFTDVADPVYYVGLGAGVMFLGISVIAPLLTKPIANVLGLFTNVVYGLIGKIAKQNAKRSPRRTASTAAALMIGVSLVSFATIFASSAKATIDDVFESSFPGDILITSQLIGSDPGDPFAETVPGGLADQIRDLSEIELVSALQYDGDVEINGSMGQLIIGVDPETFDSAFRLNPTDGNYDALTQDAIYIRQATLDSLGLAVGDDINVVFARTGEQMFRIAGAFEEAFDSPYIISSDTFAANSTITNDFIVVANIDPDQTIEAGRDAIRSELEGFPTVQVQDKNELISEIRTQIDQALVLLSGLLGFAIIIAVLGITNTLTLSVAERTREIGMLRAIGMTRRQVRRMIRAESIIIAVFGALLGMVMGIFFAWAILRSLEDLGFTAFSIPVVQLVVYLFMAVIAGIIAAIAPSFKASRMNILNAINYE